MRTKLATSIRTRAWISFGPLLSAITIAMPFLTTLVTYHVRTMPFLCDKGRHTENSPLYFLADSTITTWTSIISISFIISSISTITSFIIIAALTTTTTVGLIITMISDALKELSGLVSERDIQAFGQTWQQCLNSKRWNTTYPNSNHA